MAEAWPIFELNAGDLELAGNKELSRKSLVYGATLDSPIAELNLAIWVIGRYRFVGDLDHRCRL